MANQTTNYGLQKPLISEKIDVNILNQNMDIIDESMKSLQENITSNKDELNIYIDTKVTDLNNEMINKASQIDLMTHINDISNPHNVDKFQVGLGEVENKSSETIRSEITKDNVINALGFTPTSSSSHPTISVGSDTTSSVTTNAGDTFSVIDKIVKDSNGHVTEINTKTVKLPTSSSSGSSSDSSSEKILIYQNTSGNQIIGEVSIKDDAKLSGNGSYMGKYDFKGYEVHCKTMYSLLHDGDYYNNEIKSAKVFTFDNGEYVTNYTDTLILSDNISIFHSNNDSSEYRMVIATRKIKIPVNTTTLIIEPCVGISFGNYSDSYGNDYTNNAISLYSTVLIPIKIYGIK